MYISQDPIRLLGGTKLYGYVTNNSLWVDPFGLEKCCLSKADKKKLKEKYSADNIKNPHQHHIVREKVPKNWSEESKKYVEESQRIIAEAGIDINTDIRNFTIASNGNGAHTVKAAKHVYDELSKSKNVEKK